MVRFLAEKAKVPAQKLAASGCGEHQPIASNKTAVGRARNRRIEILLTPAPTTKSKLKPAAAAKTGGKVAATKQADKKTDKTKKSGKKSQSGKTHVSR